MAFDLDYCLRLLVETGGSDLHLKVPAPPVMRIDGAMRPGTQSRSTAIASTRRRRTRAARLYSIHRSGY